MNAILKLSFEWQAGPSLRNKNTNMLVKDAEEANLKLVVTLLPEYKESL